MGVNSKRKGKVGELEFAHLCASFGFTARRGQQYKGTPDSPDVVGLPYLHIEVKRRERFSLYDALEQSERESRSGEIPIVAYRKNRKPWVIILRAEDFFTLYNAFLQAQEGVVENVAGEEAQDRVRSCRELEGVEAQSA